MTRAHQCAEEYLILKADLEFFIPWATLPCKPFIQFVLPFTTTILRTLMYQLYTTNSQKNDGLGQTH